MEKSSYLQVVSKLKYKRSDATEEQRMSDLTKYDQTQCMENLHELNERFVKYINRARVLEQRNAVFKKQLETLQRMEEISGLEEAFTEQLIFNRQRLKELCADQSKLERELRNSQSTLDEFWTKYRNECECQEQLRGTLEHLNKEADEALLDNLALQIQLQFLQDDMNATKDRYKKNLKEVQTYVNILQQIVQTTPCAVALTGGLYMLSTPSDNKQLLRTVQDNGSLLEAQASSTSITELQEIKHNPTDYFNTRTLKFSTEPRFLSDHSRITLEINLTQNPANIIPTWSLNPNLLQDKSLISEINLVLKDLFSTQQDESIIFDIRWAAAKAVLRGTFIKKASFLKKKRTKRLTELHQDITNLDKKLIDNYSENTEKELIAKQKELSEFHQSNLSIWEYRCIAKYSEYIQTPSKSLASLILNTPRSPRISCLQYNNQLYRSDENIIQLFHQIYSQTYNNSNFMTTKEEMKTFLKEITFPSATEPQRNLLASQITTKEILEAIDNLKIGKAPGPDGFSPEFYKTFKETLTPILLELFKSLINYGIKDSYINDSRTILIPKNTSDTTNPNNYRPISLMNVDIKILSSILANRLKKVMEDLISPEQAGFQTPGTKGRAAALQNQLEEFKTALCHFQTEKQKMQTEIALLEQTIKSTQESYDDEIQLYNEKIDDLRKELDEMEKILEKHTSVSHRLMMYKQALENEVDRYKQIIDNEGNRLNSAIAGVPVTIFTQSISYSHPPVTRTKDITLAIQDITSAKQRQKSNPKKLSKMMVIVTKEKSVDDNEGNAEIEEDDEGQSKLQAEEVVERAEAEEEMHPCNEASEDVPDGTQISKVFDTLCSVVKERMRRHKKPEPIVNIFTKGRYVLVTGEASYVDPFFISSSPAGSQVIVNILNGMPTDEGNSQPTIPLPEPFTGKGNEVSKPGHAGDSSDVLTEHEGIDENRDKGKTDADKNDNVNHPHETNSHECCQGKNQEDSFKSKSYEKVEVVESIEHVSEHKNRAYEETAMIVETVIEKTRKKKHGGKTA
ncbi:filensin [Protopterus annectens]|uniref:filensin n=1 Tax=Protopterus annectens TaxID=7888 RepID=UPI001CFAF7F5|nr:filensin [Protopterus annectens]